MSETGQPGFIMDVMVNREGEIQGGKSFTFPKDVFILGGEDITGGLVVHGGINIIGGEIIGGGLQVKGGPLLLGDGPNVPVNVSQGVIMMKSLSDATYGTPVGGVLLYVDSDNQVKTKNTAGQVYRIGVPWIAKIYLFAPASVPITTQNVSTGVLGPFTFQNFNGSFTMVDNYKLRYGGTPSMNCRISVKGILLSGLSATSCAIRVYKNAIINGANEVTSGAVMITQYLETSNLFYSGFYAEDFIAGINTGDYFTLTLLNGDNTNSYQIAEVVLSIEMISAGTD